MSLWEVCAPNKVASCRCSTSLVAIVKVQWQLKGKVLTPNRFTGSGSSGQFRQPAFGCSLGVSLRLQCQWPETLSSSLPLSYLLLPPTLLAHVHSVGEEKVFYHSTSCGLQVCSLLSSTTPSSSLCLIFIPCLSSLQIREYAAWLIRNCSYIF